MHSSDFNDLVDKRLQFCCQTLKAKADEYATHDRLHNFKQAAALQCTSPEQALLGMWSKHIVSVVDMIQTEETPSRELLGEKITDLINYALLLEGLLEERRAKDCMVVEDCTDA